MAKPSVCLITSRHISYNPRLVKEADALQAAGYHVRVVAPVQLSERAVLDEELASTRDWLFARIHATGHTRASQARRMWAAVRQRVCSLLYPRGGPYVRDAAYSRFVTELASTAAAEPADLYIAHNLQALPATVRAARTHGTRVGFDAEDFHRGEFSEVDVSLQKRLTIKVEDAYIPLCDHVTAASEGIAAAYAEVLGIDKPTVILNVFPLTERKEHTPSEELAQEKPEGVVSLYWYSQVIGPGRGLKGAVQALSLLDDTIHLSLRGHWRESFRDELVDLANALGIRERLHHLPPAPPKQLVERAAQHDIGLALEQGHTRNRDVCVTNKLLVYLLAGVPVVATATTGQQHICETVPEATRLCASGGPEKIADAVRSLMRDGKVQYEARAAAYRAGTERYNWEREQFRLLRAVEEALAMKTEGSKPYVTSQ
jgi:glycosyltransferase involved in cell wall biosynthesis